MYFSENLIIGEQILDKENIVDMLKKGVKIYGIFLICVSKQGNNILEILESTQIFKKMHNHDNYTVIAISNSKKEAFSIVESLAKDYYDNNYTHTFKENIIKIF